MARQRCAAMLVVIVGLLTACSSGGSKAAAPPATAAVAPTPTTKGLHVYAQQYLAIIGPASAAEVAWKAAITKLGDNPPTADIAAATAPFIAAVQKADSALLRAQWPGTITPDIRALVSAHGALIGDLNVAGGQSVFSAGDWEARVSADGGKANAAANIVRADLGLPPPSS